MHEADPASVDQIGDARQVAAVRERVEHDDLRGRPARRTKLLPMKPAPPVISHALITLNLPTT
jgi:hypothetical protein